MLANFRPFKFPVRLPTDLVNWLQLGAAFTQLSRETPHNSSSSSSFRKAIEQEGASIQSVGSHTMTLQEVDQFVV